MNKTGKNIICQTCGKEFYAPLWLLKKGYGKYCSLECRRHNDIAKNKMSIAKIGKKPWNKGLTKQTDKRIDYERPTKFKSQGKCELQEIIRHCYKYRQWRSDVFTRDNFTCQECGLIGGKLNADHIKPFSWIIKDNNIKTLEEAMNCEELWNINNGRTLCLECHKKTDTFMLGSRYNYFAVASLDFSVPA